MDNGENDIEGGHRRSGPQSDGAVVSFRPLCPDDRRVIQEYHEEWFPVRYDDEFFDELVKNRMVGNPRHRLYTQCACYEHGEDEEVMAACIVGSFGWARRLSPDLRDLIISDSLRFTKVFYIMTLGTVGCYRQAGLAQTLVENCLNLVDKDPACGAVYLHVITFNIAAIKFYEKLGFYRVQEIKDYYVIEGHHYNCYLYAKYFHGEIYTFSKQVNPLLLTSVSQEIVVTITYIRSCLGRSSIFGIK